MTHKLKKLREEEIDKVFDIKINLRERVIKISKANVDDDKKRRAIDAYCTKSLSNNKVIESSKSLVEFEIENLRIIFNNPPDFVVKSIIDLFFNDEDSHALYNMHIKRSLNDSSNIHFLKLVNLIDYDLLLVRGLRRLKDFMSRARDCDLIENSKSINALR